MAVQRESVSDRARLDHGRQCTHLYCLIIAVTGLLDMEQDPEPGMLEISKLRLSIDNLDAALVSILAERFRCTRKIGQIKAALSIPTADPEREAVQAARIRELATLAQLDPDFAVAVQQFIVHEVLRQHQVVRQ